MEELKGWAIDLDAVYGGLRKARKRFHLSEDLWEAPDGHTAVLLYGIGEIGISKEVGRLAILRNKEKPVIDLKLPRLLWWYFYDATVQFGRDGIVFVHRYKPGRRVSGCTLCALDPRARRMAALDALPRDSHRVSHVEGTRYAFEAMAGSDRRPAVLDLKDLSWKRCVLLTFRCLTSYHDL